MAGKREGWSLNRHNTITSRELQVLEALAHGYSNQGIADRGPNAPYALKSIENTINDLYRKLGLISKDPQRSNRVMAAKYYWEVMYRGNRS